MKKNRIPYKNLSIRENILPRNAVRKEILSNGKERFYYEGGDFWETGWAGWQCCKCNNYVTPEEGVCHTCHPNAG